MHKNMRMMWPTYFVSKDERKFDYDTHCLDTDEAFTRGRTPLPVDGGPYTVEFAYDLSPKPRMSEELADTIHNIMCLVHHEEMEWLIRTRDELKAMANRSFFASFFMAAINFVTNEVSSFCNKEGIGIMKHPMAPERMVDVVTLMALREEVGIGADVVAKVMKLMMEDPALVYADALERSLPVNVSNDELTALIREAMAEAPDKVEEYRKGKKGIASMMIGVVMRKKKGLDPKMVKEMIEVELNKSG